MKKHSTINGTVLAAAMMLVCLMLALAPAAARAKTTIAVPDGSIAFKAWMPYTAITNTGSAQYRLQLKASTDQYGIRTYKGRYLIAIGSGYGARVGQYVRLKMANGTYLKCIIGDMKSDYVTVSGHKLAANGSVAEFIIDRNTLNESAKRMGDISYADDKFAGLITHIVVYNKFVPGV